MVSFDAYHSELRSSGKLDLVYNQKYVDNWEAKNGIKDYKRGGHAVIIVG